MAMMGIFWHSKTRGFLHFQLEVSFLEKIIISLLCCWDVNDLPGVSGTFITWSLRVKKRRKNKAF